MQKTSNYLIIHLKPKISIISPSFNQVQYLEQTIESVFSQIYQNFEYIIIDGNSNDGSIDIIKRHQKELTYWVSEPDIGQSHAINKGIKRSEGEIINWLNTDDYYERNALSIIKDAFQHQEVKAVVGRSRIFQGDKTISYSRGTDIFPGNLAKTIGWARIDQPETFFRKEAWEKVGLLNEQLHYTMDREWWMRFLYVFGLVGIVQIDDVLVNFRLHEDSKTVSSKEKFQIEHDTIFYILSTLSEDKNIQDVLSTNLKIDFSIDSEIRKWTNPHIIEGSINYYLLKRAEKLYYRGETSLSRDFLSSINKSFLAEGDIDLYKRIAFRSRLPSSIISFFRK